MQGVGPGGGLSFELLEQAGHRGMPFLQFRCHHGIIRRQRKVAEIETGPHRTPRQRISPGRSGGLPPSRRDDSYRVLPWSDRAQLVMLDPAEILGQPEVQRCSLIEVPDLIGENPVPPAHLTLRQQEVDGREGATRPPAVRRLDGGRRTVHFTVVATLRMGYQAQGGDQRQVAVHRRGHLPSDPVMPLSIPLRVATFSIKVESKVGVP
jgi:hypothetical protein